MDKDLVFSLADLSTDELLDNIRRILIIHCVPKGKQVEEEELFRNYADLVRQL